MKYMEVYNDIKKKIKSNYYQSWASLDVEETLCLKYDVSRPTVRKAIAKLKAEGYIHSRQGSGMFINPPEFYEYRNFTTLSEKKKDVKNEVLLYETVEAGEELAEIFNCKVGAEFVHYKRIRIIKGKTESIEETYMPKYLFSNFTKDVLYGSVLRYMEEEHKVSHAMKTIKAVNLRDEDASLLEVNKALPTLEITHKVYLVKSVLAQYTKEIVRENNISIASVR